MQTHVRLRSVKRDWRSAASAARSHSVFTLHSKQAIKVKRGERGRAERVAAHQVLLPHESEIFWITTENFTPGLLRHTCETQS